MSAERTSFSSGEMAQHCTPYTCLLNSVSSLRLRASHTCEQPLCISSLQFPSPTKMSTPQRGKIPPFPCTNQNITSPPSSHKQPPSHPHPSHPHLDSQVLRTGDDNLSRGTQGAASDHVPVSLEVCQHHSCGGVPQLGGRHNRHHSSSPDSTHPPTHSLPTHPLTHSFTHPPTHSLPTHPLMHSFTHPPTHPPTHSPTHSLTSHPPTHSLTHPLTHSPTHSPTHPLISTGRKQMPNSETDCTQSTAHTVKTKVDMCANTLFDAHVAQVM